MKIYELLSDVSGKKENLQSVKDHKRLAKKLGVTVNQLKLFSDDQLLNLLHELGEHDFVPDSEFNKRELAMGIKVEKEHTSSDLIAKLIAKDHLVELPDYYSRLEKMEQE